MTSLIAFVKNHPVIGGVAFAVFGVFMVFVSIDGAKRFRLYENAREITGQVLSITEASRVPPRFDITVSWTDGSSAERSLIRTGPKAVDDLKEGDSVQILVSTVNGAVIHGLRSGAEDRKSTRLNSSHDQISYAVFCLKIKQIYSA